MKIKKKIKKFLFYLRRDICRAIVSYDNCPVDCRKNYKGIFTNILNSLLLAIVACGLMILLILFSI